MVEDNPDVLRLNKKWLEDAGYDTVSAETLNEARRVLECQSPDVVILDIMLPDGDGLKFMSELKTLCEAPVLLCSGKNEDKDVLRGLETGGDDYITKPYNVDILVARVGVMCRKEQSNREKTRAALAAKTPEREIVRGPLKLDIISGRAYMNGEDTGLTPKEFALLFALIMNEMREVSAKELYEEVWRLPSNDDPRTIKKHISNIRGKLSIDENTSLAITTEYGNGYRFEWRKI